MPGFFKPAAIGVDLGGTSIKAVRLRGKKVLLAAYVDIPTESREDPKLLTGVIAGFIQGIGAVGKPAVIGLPGDHSFVRTINLPPMPHAELREAVKWEVKRQLPYPPEDAVYDYVALEAADGIAVTFASAEKAALDGYLKPFREAGLKVAAVDVNPLCLIRALRPKAPGNTIMVDIGGVSTEINIVKAGVLKMTRTTEIGGSSIKRHLEDKGHGDRAEEILRQGSEGDLRESLDEVLREITRSMDYYQANFKERTFSSLVLTGGVAINPAIRNYFSGLLDIPVAVPDPFEGLSMKDASIRAIGPRFSVAVGLSGRPS